MGRTEGAQRGVLSLSRWGGTRLARVTPAAALPAKVAPLRGIVGEGRGGVYLTPATARCGSPDERRTTAVGVSLLSGVGLPCAHLAVCHAGGSSWWLNDREREQ